MVLYNSFSFTMDGALVKWNNTSNLSANNKYTHVALDPALLKKTANVTPKRSNQEKSYILSKMDYLNRAAEIELHKREETARRISDQINEQYIGIGDQWSLKKQLILWAGLSGAGYVDIKDAIKDLTEISSHINVDLNRPLIEAVREKNYRFDGLIKRLIKEKIIMYSLQGNSHFFRPCIVGSNIDEFLDSQHTLIGLPTSLQRYIQLKVEQTYRNFFGLKDCVPFIPHVLRTAFLNSKCSEHQLEALLQSSTLRKLVEINIDTAYLFSELIGGAIAELHADKHFQCTDSTQMQYSDSDIEV